MECNKQNQSTSKQPNDMFNIGFNFSSICNTQVPQDPSSLRKNIHFCQSCNSYLPSTEFQLSSNSKVIGKCRRCTKLDNDARTRQDFSHYRYMLRSLRKTEENMQDGSRIAFLLQVCVGWVFNSSKKTRKQN